MSARGYVTDVPYVHSFQPEVAPAYLDHVVVLSGFDPPGGRAGFTFCDLGCGHGITATLLAGTHPDGRFFGIDLMPEHVAQAKQFSADAQVTNVSFVEADFARAATLDLPKFDYIVSHGVYSWVDVSVQRELLAFVDRFLKPGGVFYVSYNAMPGRGPDAAFQYLLRALAGAQQGDSIARVKGALPLVQSIGRLKAPALVGSFTDVDLEQFPAAYLAHEFMNERWRPLFVTDVRADMAGIGLVPAGSATLIDNFDSFVLGRAARDILAKIEDDNLRELARDYFLDQSFRRDVFIRDGRDLDDEERRERLLNGTYAVMRPQGQVEFSTATPAGKLDFDNEFTRTIVASMANGPRRLIDVADSGKNRASLLANAMVLCAARVLQPVAATPHAVKSLNQAMYRRSGSGGELRFLAHPHGTAMSLDRRVAKFACAGGPLDESLNDWRAVLVAHGIVGRSEG